MRKDVRFYTFLLLLSLQAGLALADSVGYATVYLARGDVFDLSAMFAWLMNIAACVGNIHTQFHRRQLRDETEYLRSLRMLFSPTRMARKTWDTH